VRLLAGQPGNLQALAWSPDGKRAVWVSSTAVVAGDPAAANPVTLAPLSTIGQAPVSVSWSAQDDILIGASGLWKVRPDGSGLTKVVDGDFASVVWSVPPGSLAFSRGSTLWTAQLPGGPPSPPVSPQAAADKVVSDFMAARVAGDSNAAQTLLDDSGRQAYSGKQNLLWRGETHLHRWYTVLEQPAGDASFRYVVRLVLARDDRDVSDVEEILAVQPSAGGALLIHSAIAGQQRQLGKGPEVVLAEVVDSTHVKLTFDSDLDPASVPSIELSSGQAAQVETAYANRVVTLTTSRPLRAGVTYRVTVPNTVKDIAGRKVQPEYNLELLGPI
jgi:hypothetical protein